MKRLCVVFLFVVFALLSCKSGDIVSSSKKGHFEQSPKITLEELLNRYQFIDTASIKWISVTDANKNEFTEVSAQIDKGLDILFKNFQDYINSEMMDASVLMNKKHEFFSSLLNEKNFKSEDDSSSYMSLRFNMFEPDYGNPNAPVFFNCNGGTLTFDFTVDKNRIVKIEKTTLILDMRSPMGYSGDIVTYQLIYPIEVEGAKNMLVNNADIGTEL